MSSRKVDKLETGQKWLICFVCLQFTTMLVIFFFMGYNLIFLEDSYPHYFQKLDALSNFISLVDEPPINKIELSSSCKQGQTEVMLMKFLGTMNGCLCQNSTSAIPYLCNDDKKDSSITKIECAKNQYPANELKFWKGHKICIGRNSKAYYNAKESPKDFKTCPDAYTSVPKK
eukprot:TRINITY_DN26441_c0_g1_i1.p1 TRINITY_DN26441_c0_g1~~TRINITY_DN26441_c0_g1_i1.p1  ORF type:complete len:173 (-),score=17.92 TRINITY_DN26441_c0_g1_i1:1-519(-)